jgi:AcrR family transcriptional regulator
MQLHEQKKTDKRERIIKTAISLFTKQGFFNTSTALIAREAGIAAGTLFTYFPSKEELIDQIYMECLNEIVGLSDESVKSAESFYEKIYSLTQSYLGWSLQNVEKFFYIDKYNSSSYRKLELVERYYQSSDFIEAFEKGRDVGIFKNISTELAVYFWTKAINGVVEYCINHEEIVDEDYKKMAVDFLMGTITIS